VTQKKSSNQINSNKFLVKKIYRAIFILFIVSKPSLSQLWDDVGGGVISNNFVGNVRSFAIDSVNNLLYVGGDFDKAGAVNNCFNIAKWNGFTWDSLRQGSFPVSALQFFNGELYVANSLRVEKWTGSTWNSVGTNNSNFGGGGIYDFEIYNNKIIAVGSFSSVDNVTVNRIGQWDGSNWTSAGTGANNTVFCATVFNSELYIGGSFTLVDGIPALYVAKWNGSVWQQVGSGLQGNVTDLCVYNGELYACGNSFSAGVRIFKWNGNNWSGASPANFPDLPIWELSTYSGKLFAIGDFGNPCCRIAEFDGFNWSSINDPGLGGIIGSTSEMIVFNNELYVGGIDITYAGTIPVNNIAKYALPVNTHQTTILNNQFILHQNNPNPFSENSEINYFIESNSKSAFVVFYNMHGVVMKTVEIKNFGAGKINISGLNINSGVYQYSLFVDNLLIDTKKFILTK
jgi:hypothetical protein